jgi:transposase
MPVVETETRWRIVALREDAGWSLGKIASHLGVPKSTVQHYVRKFGTTNSVSNGLKSGRPRAMDAESDQLVTAVAISQPFVTLPELQQTLRETLHVTTSQMTISRRLASAGLKSYRTLKFPKLTAAHRAARLHWAHHHRHWSAQQHWRHVVFTDESRFSVQWKDGRLRVRRERNSRYVQQDAVQWVTRRGGSGGSVMVWAAASWNHLSAIELIDGTLNGRGYADILRNVAVPFGLASVGPGFLLQDDNATPHRCAAVLQLHEQQQQYVHMHWPANSPDLNPIEHLWDELGRRLSRGNVATFTELAPRLRRSGQQCRSIWCAGCCDRCDLDARRSLLLMEVQRVTDCSVAWTLTRSCLCSALVSKHVRTHCSSFSYPLRLFA